MTKLTSAQIALIDKRVSIDTFHYVVLLDVGGRKDVSDVDYNSNVYCIDGSDNVVWQISAPTSKHGRDSFVSINLDAQKLRADRFFGNEYLVDVSTGEAIETGWHK